MTEPGKCNSALRSIGACVAGFLVIVAATIGTDAVFQAIGVYPGWQRPMAGHLWGLALFYRIVYGVGGGYVAARISRMNSIRNATIVGFLSLAISVFVVVSHWGKGPEYGPMWFNLIWAATTLPCAWLGGRLRVSRGQ